MTNFATHRFDCHHQSTVVQVMRSNRLSALRCFVFTSFVYFTIFDWCVSKWVTVVLVSLGKLSLDLESSQSSTSSEKNYEQRFSILLQWFFKHLDVSKKMFLCFCNENLFLKQHQTHVHCALCQLLLILWWKKSLCVNLYHDGAEKRMECYFLLDSTNHEMRDERISGTELL